MKIYLQIFKYQPLDSAGNSHSRDGRSVQGKPLGMSSPESRLLGLKAHPTSVFPNTLGPTKGKTEVCWA